MFRDGLNRWRRRRGASLNLFLLLRFLALGVVLVVAVEGLDAAEGDAGLVEPGVLEGLLHRQPPHRVYVQEAPDEILGLVADLKPCITKICQVLLTKFGLER